MTQFLVAIRLSREKSLRTLSTLHLLVIFYFSSNSFHEISILSLFLSLKEMFKTSKTWIPLKIIQINNNSQQVFDFICNNFTQFKFWFWNLSLHIVIQIVWINFENLDLRLNETKFEFPSNGKRDSFNKLVNISMTPTLKVWPKDSLISKSYHLITIELFVDIK